MPGRSWLQILAWHWLYWQVSFFRVFLISTSKMLKCYLISGHNHLISCPRQFFIHSSSYNLMLYNHLCYWNCWWMKTKTQLTVSSTKQCGGLMKLKLIIIISHLNNWNYKPHLLLQFMTYCLVQSPFSFFLIWNNSFFNHVRDFHSKPRSKLKNTLL